jgi:2-polyprenyl-3-methyl-5-hydroxy-6-metoxy-1,4-benzoquinol methylase
MNLDPFYDELEESLRKELPTLLNGVNALDVGCGRGWLTRLLNNDFNLSVLGIDKSRENIKSCLSNAKSSDLKYEIKDVAELDSFTFENYFSFISCHNVLGYLHSPEEQLYKMYSWLETNGVFSLVTRSPSGWFAEAYERFKSASRAFELYQMQRMIGSFGEHCELFLPSDLLNMIEGAGFSVLKKQGLYSLKKYLPNGYKELTEWIPQREREEHFFQWVLCKKK